ncbi:MAG: winged helix-turn-helix domain-containing protein [Kofleriaceae bacterium]|nr:winged helix-turn-helix domain-containing protein [Kofleriaceae bacterium]
MQGHPVLVVSGDIALRRSLGQVLAAHGYTVAEADATQRLDLLVARTRPLLLVLDLDRPDGERLAPMVRVRDASRELPMIALSVRGDEGDKVAALDVGADDYLTKPIGTSELLARIRVVLRRMRSDLNAPDVLEAGDVRIDRARYEVTVDGKLVHLTPIEFRLLAMLARTPGKVVTREVLLHHVWGPNTDQAHYLRVHIAALRQKLGAHKVLTVTGIGYRLADR